MTTAELTAAVKSLNATVIAQAATIAETNTHVLTNSESDLDIFWLLFGAYIVFFMQAGFALLEAGCVRAKNTKNILLKNVLDACLGGIIWWFIGYPLAFGDPGSGTQSFIGGKDFFFEGRTAGQNGSATYFAFWLFQWAFAAAAATIVSGAVAERCAFGAYLVYSSIITAFIYPVVVHWGWSGEGWLAAYYTTKEAYLGANGMMDFAGSGIVHMTGGCAALMGAIFLGPRTVRFRPDGTVVEMKGHSTVLAALGTFILWFGWYGFNPVSTLAFQYMVVAARCAVTTTLAACAGGSGVLIIHVAMGNPPDVGPALNGILAGLVSITAGCPVMEPWAAFLTGLIAAPVYYGSSKMLLKLRIDDPLDASPVHFFCGIWGVLAVGLFADEEFTKQAYYDTKHWGALMGGGGKQLGNQIVGILAITAWVSSTSGLTFFALKMAKMLRVSAEDENEGLDSSHHGGSAYDFQVTGKA